jgi:hypothetical protein
LVTLLSGVQMYGQTAASISGEPATHSPVCCGSVGVVGATVLAAAAARK